MTNPTEELKHARRALWLVAQMGGTHTQLIMQYIGLFAPKGARLAFDRISELLADVKEITNDYEPHIIVKAINGIVAEYQGQPLIHHEMLAEALALVADYERHQALDDPEHEHIGYYFSSQSGTPIIPTVPPQLPEKRQHTPPPKPTEAEIKQRHAETQNMLKRLNQKRYQPTENNHEPPHQPE